MLSVDHNDRFISYMKEHHSSWIQYVRDTTSAAVTPDSIVLVRGWVKASEWAIATFKSKYRLASACINAGFIPTESVGFHLSISQKTRMLCAYHTGPLGSAAILDDHDSRPINQCIFLRYYKMKFRLGVFPKIMRAAAGPAPLPDGMPEDNGQEVLADEDFEIETEEPGPAVSATRISTCIVLIAA